MRVLSGLRSPRTNQGFEGSGHHQFQRAFGQNRLRILPIEHLPLFGNLKVTTEGSHRLRHHRAMGRAAAAANRPTASVKDGQVNVRLVGHAMQFAMRLVDLPQTGEHAAVFVAVGVAQHDLLFSAPGIEQPCIRR